METSSANFRIFERPFQFHVFRQFDGIAQKDIWSVHDQFLRVYHVIGQPHLNKKTIQILKTKCMTRLPGLKKRQALKQANSRWLTSNFRKGIMISEKIEQNDFCENVSYHPFVDDKLTCILEFLHFLVVAGE